MNPEQHSNSKSQIQKNIVYVEKKCLWWATELLLLGLSGARNSGSGSGVKVVENRLRNHSGIRFRLRLRSREEDSSVDVSDLLLLRFVTWRITDPIFVLIGKASEAAQSAYYDPNKPQCAYVPPPAYYVSIRVRVGFLERSCALFSSRNIEWITLNWNRNTKNSIIGGKTVPRLSKICTFSIERLSSEWRWYVVVLYWNLRLKQCFISLINFGDLCGRICRFSKKKLCTVELND